MLDTKRLIAEVAARNGIRVDPDDPAFALVTLVQLVLEESSRQITDDMRASIAEFERSVQRVETRAGKALAERVKEAAHEFTVQLQQRLDERDKRALSMPHRSKSPGANQRPTATSQSSALWPAPSSPLAYGSDSIGITDARRDRSRSDLFHPPARRGGNEIPAFSLHLSSGSQADRVSCVRCLAVEGSDQRRARRLRDCRYGRNAPAAAAALAATGSRSHRGERSRFVCRTRSAKRTHPSACVQRPTDPESQAMPGAPGQPSCAAFFARARGEEADRVRRRAA